MAQFGDSRRSTAAQFFMDEDEAAGNEPTPQIPTHDRVVELLNQASLLQKDAQKITNLKKVQELIIHKDSNLLDSFLEEVISFQSDHSQEVRKFVVGFMEEACKKDPEILMKGVGSLSILLSGESIQVTKKVMLCMGNIYKVALQWMVKAKDVTEVMGNTWKYIIQMKDRIVDMLESENDGIRTHAVKFAESLVITLSKKTSMSETPKKQENDMTVDQVPETHLWLRIKKLEEEGRSVFDQLLQFLASAHISSVNLMTCLGALTNIGKQRPVYIDKVVQSFEALHVNLPPTLATSQVSSVRKNLKMQMLSLLRHPSSYGLHTQITTLLTDLGATASEVTKAIPKDFVRKRKAEESIQVAKKQKVEPAAEGDDDEDITSPSASTSQPTSDDPLKKAIDITAEDLVPKLTPQNVADLVLLSMVMLPDAMPPQFQATYTPIAAAGTSAQITHLSRLLANQLTSAGLGKGSMEVSREEPKVDEDATSPDYQPPSPRHTIQTVVGGSVTGQTEETMTSLMPVPAQGPRKVVKQFKLTGMSHKLNKSEVDAMAHDALVRILKAEKVSSMGNASMGRIKLMTSIVTLFGGAFKDVLQTFIFGDLRARGDLALAWVYQEYALYQKYTLATADQEKTSIASYDECLTRLLNGLLERPDQKEGLFSRLVLEAPLITPNAIEVLRRYCQDEERIYLGMITLKDLILRRPSKKLEFLDVLLEFAAHENVEVRNHAIRVTKKLHQRSDLMLPIETAASYTLKLLLKTSPPQELFDTRTKLEPTIVWTEDLTKLCLYLYLGLLPVNHRLIHELANVYTATSADVKRTILRVIEHPVKGMGMQSPELLTLVENCPKGAETLITRIIHILTDKAAPSAELVHKVRDLYHKRVSDVRFLIPVLTGLTKAEVISALPKLIKLNPVVVKEVFNRLLGAHGGESYVSPLTPQELLIALHNIDQAKCDMKTIIKALNLCFAEKGIYTQEVLAIVIQHLMEQSPLPTLLMRTVIQSLSMYTKLVGFVMNVMHRLITKQVWKHKRVWEGFVRCCHRTQPQSFQVLLQLPAAQLKSAFEICPDMRESLLNTVKTMFTAHQRAHIPKAIMTILEKDPEEEIKAAERAQKEEAERMAEQDRLYQEKLEEERKRQQTKAEETTTEKPEKMETESVTVTEKVAVTEKVEVVQSVRTTRSSVKEKHEKKVTKDSSAKEETNGT